MERRTEKRSWRRPLIWLAVGCAVVMLATASMAVVAWRTPLKTERTEIGTSISQRGTYSWTASLKPNHLYDRRRVSGETTIFTNVTRAINMEFSYRMSALGARELNGTCAVDLVIRGGQNWSKRIPVAAERRFSAKGDTVTFWSQFSLDIASLSGLIGSIERETGIASPEYTLVIEPSVATTVAGTTASNETFVAPLELIWSDQRRQITMPTQREFASERAVPVVTTIPGEIPLFGLRLPVAPVRLWAGTVAGVAALLTIWLAVLARRTLRQAVGVEQRIRKAHARLFIDGKGELPPELPTVSVRDLGQLVRIARATGKLIIPAEAESSYFLVDGGMAYLYGNAAASAMRWTPAVVPVSAKTRRSRL